MNLRRVKASDLCPDDELLPTGERVLSRAMPDTRRAGQVAVAVRARHGLAERTWPASKHLVVRRST